MDGHLPFLRCIAMVAANYLGLQSQTNQNCVMKTGPGVEACTTGVDQRNQPVSILGSEAKNLPWYWYCLYNIQSLGVTADTERAGTQPNQTKLSPTQPNSAQLSPTQPNSAAQHNQTLPTPTQLCPAQPNSTQPNPTLPNPTKLCSTQPNSAQPNQTQPNPTQLYTTKHNQTLTIPTKPNAQHRHTQLSICH